MRSPLGVITRAYTSDLFWVRYEIHEKHVSSERFYFLPVETKYWLSCQISAAPVAKSCTQLKNMLGLTFQSEFRWRPGLCGHVCGLAWHHAAPCWSNSVFEEFNNRWKPELFNWLTLQLTFQRSKRELIWSIYTSTMLSTNQFSRNKLPCHRQNSCQYRWI